MINGHNSTSESSLHRGGGLLVLVRCPQLLLLHNCPGQTPTIPWQYLTISCHAIPCHTIQRNTLQCNVGPTYHTARSDTHNIDAMHCNLIPLIISCNTMRCQTISNCIIMLHAKQKHTTKACNTMAY